MCDDNTMNPMGNEEEVATETPVEGEAMATPEAPAAESAEGEATEEETEQGGEM